MLLLENSGREAAIAYARAHFQQFTPKYQIDIQKMMGCLLFNEYIDFYLC